ncbi:MAG: class I SAM-dependent methyltransferase [Bacteroidia bacterium]
MLLLSPEKFPDYELLDCGDFEKLERFGKYITIRPEPQAVWSKKLSNGDWEKTAHVKFIQKSSSSGEWKKLKEIPDRWNMRYVIASEAKQSLSFRLALTSFKHVGIFPEQAVNWEYISESISLMKIEKPKFLNLFAYTGAASLAAKAAGADVTHLDSIKQVVTWARENMELSGLKDIRWIVEDAMKFVKREVKRGNKYHGIILDPPAFGNGPEGEKWKLEDNIQEMMQNVFQLLDEKNHFMILNAYSLGFSSLIIENLLKDFAKDKLEMGELFLQSKTNVKLPLGVFGRFRSF